MRSVPRAVREAGGRAFLAEVGINITPELGAALFDDAREKLITGGWQAGKSVAGAAETWIELPFMDRMRRDPYRYWYVVPSYQDPHKEVDYLHAWASRLGIVSAWHAPDNGACSLALLGGRVLIETRTAKNVAGIAGEACDGVVVVEAGQDPSDIRSQAQGRVVTRGGWISYTGTLEDDENHPRWAWYAELASEWASNPPGADVRSFSLPTWSNPLFNGEFDPRIQALRETLDEYTFARRVAAIPTGVQNQVYPQVTRKPLLKPMPQDLVWVGGAGGVDFGSVHPSALTVVKLQQTPGATKWSDCIGWVVECVYLTGEEAIDSGRIAGERRRLMIKWDVAGWATDPNERYMASEFGEASLAVRTGDGARQGRIGLVSRRLNQNLLFYDANGEGVPALYYEQGRVHYRKDTRGQLVLHRVLDDRTASLEDAIELIDGVPQGLPVHAGTMEIGEKAAAPVKPDPWAFAEPPTKSSASQARRGLPGRARR